MTDAGHRGLTQLDPAAYAPYDDPVSYILDWTDRIWSENGMGLIREMYAPDLVVHGAHGDIHGAEAVVRDSIMTRTSFPTKSGVAEDVVWEPRGRDAFISYHRVLHVGTQDEVSAYGPPTRQASVAHGIAVCLVRDGRVVEEWVVRDEHAVVTQLGFDAEAIAERLAAAAAAVAPPADRFGPPPAAPLHEGDSGPRPDGSSREVEVVAHLFDRVINERMFQDIPELVDRDVVVRTARGRTAVRADGYLRELTRLLGPFPDAVVELRDLAEHVDDFHGHRVSALWRLRGTYDGVPLYGPTTGSVVDVLGTTAFTFRDGRIHREWRVHNDVAVMAQIARAGRAGSDEA